VNNFEEGSVARNARLQHSVARMNLTAVSTAFRCLPQGRAGSAKELFRERFQRSLRSCLRRGFCLEESFGMIWVETWEEIPLTDREQGELYDELINWAKNARV
jgi:hypothetical protein